MKMKGLFNFFAPLVVISTLENDIFGLHKCYKLETAFEWMKQYPVWAQVEIRTGNRLWWRKSGIIASRKSQ